MVIGMHHLMRHRVFQMALMKHMVRTDAYAVVGIEAPCLLTGASSATDISAVEVAVQLGDLLAQKSDRWT